MSDERLKIAVFVDFDNIEIGVKTTLGSYFDVGAVLEAIKERGEVVTKVAYGDWTRATDYGRSMSQHAVHMVQRNLTPGGDKNGADINLALDALEMAFTHSHINAFVIVGGDSDFITLVEKLKQYDRKVFVVGGRAFTSQVMQKNCTEFVAYEDIIGVPSRGRHTERGGRSGGEANLAAAMPLIKRALKLLADREVVPQLGLLKSTLLQLDSSFSERAYGCSSFRDFVQKLAKAGYVALKGTDRSFHVELREGAEAASPAAEKPERGEKPERSDRHERGERTERGERPERGERHERPERAERPEAERAEAAVPSVASPTDAEPTGEAATAAGPEPMATDAGEPGDEGPVPEDGPPRLGPVEGFRIIQAAFSRPGFVPRFPMYIRQVKQFVRQYDESFDERRYGFSGLVDALRYGQREGVFRLDRDRQGVVRVFPGVKLRPTAEPQVEGVAAGAEAPEAVMPPLPGLEMLGESAHPPYPTVSEVEAGTADEAVTATGEGEPSSSAEPTVESATYDVVTHVDPRSGVIDVGRHEDPQPAPTPAEADPADGRGRKRKTASAGGTRTRAPRPAGAKAGTKPATSARKRTPAASESRRGARKRTNPEQD